MKSSNYLLIISFFCHSIAANAITQEPEKLLPNICVSTIPKSGTHLLSRIIHLITNRTAAWANELTIISQGQINEIIKNKQFFITHAPCVAHNAHLLKKNNFKVIFLIRDPRDVLVSYAHWVKKNPYGNLLHVEYPHINELKQWTMSEVISHFIDYYPVKAPLITENYTIAEFYNLYLSCTQYPDVLLTSFEKLIGPRGGGSKQMQIDEIMKIAEFIGMPVTYEKANDISDQIFGKSDTFREGRIGSWADSINLEQKKHLKNISGFNELLVTLNYEKDSLW